MIPPSPLLEGRGISKSFPIEGGIFRHTIGTVQALKDVSFHVAEGETLALVGGSGCGKSTLAKILAGLLFPNAGTLQWKGQTLDTTDRLAHARRIQMIFQDPFASLNPKLSIGTQLGDVVRLTGAADVNSRCVELLKTVGLPADVLASYAFQFSGGQRQRVAIARALAMQPALLIADEPLSALDVTIQARILDLLRELKKSYNLTILLISHDLAVVDSFADRIIVLQDGQVVEEGPVSQVLAAPKQPYTQALLNAVPRISL